LYASGAGVNQDTDKARNWLSIAADNGNESAAKLLELLDQ